MENSLRCHGNFTMTSIPRELRPADRLYCELSVRYQSAPIMQGGREMSAPRPYKTDPLHPPALFTSCITISFSIIIYKTVSGISSMWYLHCELENCSFIIYACAFPELQTSAESRFTSFSKSFSPCGTYWYEIHYICTCAF